MQRPFGFDFSKKVNPAIEKACKEQMEQAKAKKRARLYALKRKYADVGLYDAIFMLFFRERRLSIPDVAWILETDEDTVSAEIDIIEQNRR